MKQEMTLEKALEYCADASWTTPAKIVVDFLIRQAKKADTTHKVGTTFSALNAEEAEPYIGRVVEFATGFVKGVHWEPGILNEIFVNIDPFEKKGDSWKNFIRLCKESFEEEKDHTGLIEALKKSIDVFELIQKTGRSKEDCYKFLGGGSNKFSCFLCDYTGYTNSPDRDTCSKCIEWPVTARGYGCYELYHVCKDSNDEKGVPEIIAHMKSELNRLQKEQEETHGKK